MNKHILLLSTFLLVALACNVPYTAVPADTQADIETGVVEAGEDSLALASPMTPVSAEPLALIPWQEPQTGAFWANVPEGWLVQGGISSSFGLLHPWMEMAHPGGNAAILYGHRQLSLNLLPHLLLEQAGFPLGSAVPLGDGTQLPVAAFQTGEATAEAEARARLQGACTDLIISDRRNNNTTTGGEVETSEGMVSFQCAAEGVSLVGEYHAVTRKLVNLVDGSGAWFSDDIAGYVAMAEQAPQVASAFQTFLTSFAFDPQWQAGQQELPGLAGLYVDQTAQANSGSSQVFEDIWDDFCIRHGC